MINNFKIFELSLSNQQRLYGGYIPEVGNAKAKCRDGSVISCTGASCSASDATATQDGKCSCEEDSKKCGTIA